MITLSSFQKVIALFLIFITTMILGRVVYSESLRFLFLLWNLFLAWVPFRLSLYLSDKTVNSNRLLAGLLLTGWLLFFPNALYLITDLIHLEERSNVPIWYDAVLLFTSAVAGLLLAFASLYKVEVFFNSRFGRSVTSRLIIVCLFAGSFGVYLGRFLRWNSWDIITNPFDLVKEITVRLVFPFEYYRTWGITLLFTAFFYLLYFTIRKLTVYGTRAEAAQNTTGEMQGGI